MPSKETVLKNYLPLCLSPVLECLNGRVDETLCLLLSENEVENLIMSDVRYCDKQCAPVFLDEVKLQ